MNIALIGATGLVGSEVLKELAARGHHVTAIVRSEGKIASAENVTPKLADATDAEALTEALRGHDMVISAFNVAHDEHEYEAFLDGSRTIQAAVKQAGVPRYLTVGGAGSLYIDGQQLVDGPDFPAAYKAGARAARDYLKELQDETELDWVFVSPPIEFNVAAPKERTGSYRLGKDEPIFNDEGRSIISPADLAIAIVDETENATHHRERFTVGY